ncbi:hypothetical protein NEOKW01_0300 [Nematocida sp. AWRm80]|nr:hypothetical protein NEOKW01_0300 [Nematocida sp. AWRm80]
MEEEKKTERATGVTLEESIKESTLAKYAEISLPKRYLVYQGNEIVSHTMNAHMVKKIKLGLLDSFRPEASRWSLVYSSEKHGYLLSTLFSMSASVPVSGCYLLSIIEEATTKDAYENVFGALFFNRIQCKASAFGTAETTLFRFRTPRKQNTTDCPNSILTTYSGNSQGNGVYIMAKKDYLAFGCSNAKFGLRLEKSLLQGESHPVITYNNERLSHHEKFNIKQIELWSIQA